MSMVVIMPGGFHPFHAGHASLYQSALKAFPNADVYVAATNDTKSRPFPFEIKEKLAKVAGVQDGRFVQVKSPFQAKEILQNYNPEEDIVVFVRSEKDRDEQPKPGGTKKDGSPAYFQPYTGKDMEPFGKHGYIAYLPTVEFGPGIKSATEIRNIWPQLNDRRKLAMVMSLYPKAQENQRLAQNIVKMLDLGMGTEEVAETIINERPGDVYSARQAEIIEDLGNGYFLGDDTYQDDEGFYKEGYTVYKKEGIDSYRMVDTVDMSPYKNPPGHIENEIKKIIASDKNNLSENMDYLEEK
jgi:glycerol-3-phosphate cytidylyltransferase-like family protein